MSMPFLRRFWVRHRPQQHVQCLKDGLSCILRLCLNTTTPSGRQRAVSCARGANEAGGVRSRGTSVYWCLWRRCAPQGAPCRGAGGLWVRSGEHAAIAKERAVRMPCYRAARIRTPPRPQRLGGKLSLGARHTARRRLWHAGLCEGVGSRGSLELGATEQRALWMPSPLLLRRESVVVGRGHGQRTREWRWWRGCRLQHGDELELYPTGGWLCLLFPLPRGYPEAGPAIPLRLSTPCGRARGCAPAPPGGGGEQPPGGGGETAIGVGLRV